MPMRRLLLLIVSVASLGSWAKREIQPRSMEVDVGSIFGNTGGTVLGRLDATVEPEWHMYSLTTPPGPIPTTIRA